MVPLAQQNNNPGDLRFAGQSGATPGKGGFAAFTTPTAGMGALLNQIQARVDKTPNENLAQFVGNPGTGYAPASDGNNVGEYVASLANQLGVSPNTEISQIPVPAFAQAIAHNEDDNTPAAKGSGLGTAATIAGGVGIGAGVAAGALSGADEIGALASSAIPTVEDAAGYVAGKAKGLIGSIFGSSNSQPSSTPTAQTPNDILSGNPDYSNIASAINGALSTTVKGTQVAQEGIKRGVPDVGAAMASMGYVPSVDANGNYDKVSPTLLVNSANSADAMYLTDAANSMMAQSCLSDMENAAIEEAKSKMQNSPDLDSTIAHIRKTFQGHSNQHPQQVDRNNNPLSRAQQFVNAANMLQMKQRASEGENWATAPHERTASQHIKTALGNMLSQHAKNEGVKGWDETNKRMEIRFLIKKAVKALPKKASRDFKKEFVHDLAASLGGALIGKTLGHGVIGGTAGYMLASRLGGPKYKSLGNKKQEKELYAKAHGSPERLVKSLLTATPHSPNKKGTT